MLPYALTVLLSAFLLFQIEPIVARMLLPWFGGSAAVWTTCMLFFQVALLLGYLYAHGCVERLRPLAQRRAHAALLLLSLLTLPIALKEGWKPAGAEDPTFRILLLLSAAVGLPYFLLSTTGPLLQAWYVGGRDEKGGCKTSPYWLYAVSNFGSMIALLSYPPLVEPHLSLRQQAGVWSWGYALFVVLCGGIALRTRGAAPAGKAAKGSSITADGVAEPASIRSPGWGASLLWIALAACSSTLLLAVTNHLSQNVASIPFLWIVPLSLYLLSFILCFAGERWEWRWYHLVLAAAAIGAMVYGLSLDVEDSQIRVIVPLFAVGLFIGCVLCHGELARRKPHPRHLTSYYLMISVGGALGGIFVGLIAPRVFRSYAEMPLSLTGCALVLSLVLYQTISNRTGKRLSLLSVGFTMALGVHFIIDNVKSGHEDRLQARNFYGVLHVQDSDPPTDPDATRTLTNGAIIHGEQFLDPKRRMAPTTYYGRDSGVGRAVREGQKRGPQRVAVIGLGTGTLAAYGRTGDVYRFYDINPLVEQLARSQFSFLAGSKAKVEVVLGDARLSLAREPKQDYDLLAVDAFSGDAIPVHLLTLEAFRLYFHHLKPEGVLAVHVSNRYVDLEPVVAAAAQSLGKEAVVVDSDADDSDDSYDASWVLVGDQRSALETGLMKGAAEPLKPRPGLRAWTDDYSSLWPVLR
jgi:SAM-dependent methyltransferase